MKVLAISGSLRKDSLNTKLVEVAMKMAEEAGAEAKRFDLKESQLPIFDVDLEADGTPGGAKKLQKAVADADVILVSTPEYNHSVSGALKNALDWVSRGKNVTGKRAVVMSASSGGFG